MTSILAPSLISTSSPSLTDTLRELSLPHSLLSLIPYDCAVEYSVLPYAIDDKGRLEVLMAQEYSTEVFL